MQQTKKVNPVMTEPADLYHANREYIGSTELRKSKQSMRHFHEAWKNGGGETTDAMDNGTMLHALLLEQDVAKFCARPLNEKGELVRSNSKEYAAFLAANEGKTPIHPTMYNGMENALTAFCENKTAMKMIEKAKHELSVYATCPHTGMKVKCRPDVWGDGFIMDLKSTTKPLDDSYLRTIFTNAFPFQLAHYGETILAATGEIIKDYYILGFEQQAPYASKIYRIPLLYIEEARALRLQWLNEIKVCMEDNKWPMYRDEIITVERPAYMSAGDEISFGGAM